MDKILGGPKSWSGCSKQKNILVTAVSQTRSLSHPPHSLATILSYYGSLLLLYFMNVTGCKSQTCVTVSVKHSFLSVLSYPLHLNTSTSHNAYERNHKLGFQESTMLTVLTTNLETSATVFMIMFYSCHCQFYYIQNQRML